MNMEWLKRKELGLPLWAWGIIVSVAIFVVWKRYGGSFSGSNSSGSGGTSGLQDANSQDASGAAAGSLIPTPLGNAVAPDASATDPLPVYEVVATGADSGSVTLPSDSSQVDTSSLAPPPAQALAPPVVPGAGLPLKWGGTSFATKSDFKLWCLAHGTTVTRELALHPAAAAIYAGLPPGYAGPVTKSGTKPKPKVVPKKTPVQVVGGSKTASSTPSSSPAQKVAVSAPSVTSGLGGATGFQMLNPTPVAAPPVKASVTTKSPPPSLQPGGRATVGKAYAS